MTPPELLLASLGGCAGYYAAQYLKKRGLASAGTRVRVSAQKAINPSRLNHFLIEVEAPVGLNEEEKRGVEQAVHHCLIHNTLLNSPRIELQVVSPSLTKGQSNETSNESYDQMPGGLMLIVS